MYSLSTLREVKEDFEWEAYLDQYYTTKKVNGKNGLEVRICCPKCLEYKYKCYVNPERHAFHCFKCDFSIKNGYDLFDLISLTEDIPKGSVITRELLAHKKVAPEISDLENKYYSQINELDSKVRIRTIDHLPVDCEKIRPTEGDPFWEYVKSRGFTLDDILVTNLHCVRKTYSPVYRNKSYKGNLGQRIVFPVYYQEGNLVGWVARGIHNEIKPKYLTSPGSDISKTLWPFSMPYDKSALIVEGIIDALAARRVEGCSAYATLGKQISKDQIEILKQWGITEVTLWYDKKDALGEMIKAAENLKMHFDKVFVLDMKDMSSDYDVGDFLSKKEGAAIIKNVLNKRINVYDELEYSKWKKTFL